MILIFINGFLLLEFMIEIPIARELSKDYIKGLEDKLAMNEGEQVLVVENEMQDCRHSSFAEEGILGYKPTFIERNFKLGVLKSDVELFYVEEKIGVHINFPTEEYVIKRDCDFKGWELKEGNISISSLCFFPLKLIFDAKPGRDPYGRDSVGLYVFHGDDVIKYFTEFTKEHLGKKDPIDLSYVSALRLLGQKIPESMKDKFNHRLDERSKRMFYNIKDIESKNESLKLKVESAYRRADLPESEEDPLAGDKVFAALNSYNDRGSIGQNKRIICDLLNQAISLGMHNRSFVFKFGPGQSVNFQDYITEMCSLYNISIS